MWKLAVAVTLVGLALFIGSGTWKRFKPDGQTVGEVAQKALEPPVVQSTPTPTATPTPTPEPTPWPTPVDVPIYLWFNYKYQKANQSEYLFFYSHTAGQAEGSGRLVKCKINKELVEGLIEKGAIQEIQTVSSKCRLLEP